MKLNNASIILSVVIYISYILLIWSFMVKTKKPIIKLDCISKEYGDYGVLVKALNEVSLDIYHGEFVSIIGTSGCGKSTLLHCMGLLDRPTSGEVYIDNKDTADISGKEIALFRGAKLGFVFQNYNLIPRLTVLENVSWK